MSDLFIVDNGDKNWKKNYLHEWANLAHKFGVSTGCRSYSIPDGTVRTIRTTRGYKQSLLFTVICRGVHNE